MSKSPLLAADSRVLSYTDPVPDKSNPFGQIDTLNKRGAKKTGRVPVPPLLLLLHNHNRHHHHHHHRKHAKDKVVAPKLDTFEGVFLPTSLNVLSILMFLRFGFILGQMGITGTFLLLIMSYTIDILTTLSISAISTNGTVKGGGAYYMISRSLGPEFGGAIGIIFFIGQILNSSLNVVGFIEPLLVNFGQIDGDMIPILPVSYWWQVTYSTILLALCTGVALVGAELVSKTAFLLFIVLSLSTISIPISSIFVRPFNLPPPLDNLYYTGLSWKTFLENLWPHFTSGAAGSGQPLGVPETFRNLFGIFFPATAGIFAGASMSGDLKTPSKSIPLGTLRGLGVTFILYSLVIASMGASIPREILHSDIKVIQTVSLHGVIILLGEFSTSLFSVIMGIVGAALMLNAIADDKIIPGLSIFTTQKKSLKQKKLAQVYSIMITWFIAQIFLFADINQIATFITMAFLMTFIVTNLACFLLRMGSAPNFRPSFKYFSSKTALLGVISCFLAMFIVDGLSATLVVIFLFFLIMMIHYLTPPLKFGDISQLLIYHQVRKYLLRLKLQMSVKYWRPQILLLCDDPRSCWELIGFCNHLKKGGLYILGHVVVMKDDTEKGKNDSEGGYFSTTSFNELRKQNEAWIKLRDFSKIKAFVQIALGPTLPWGVRNVYLGSGLGGMRPNITVIGFYEYIKHGVDLPVFKKKIDHLPTDTLRKERKISIGQWVQIIEDLIVMQATVAVAANFARMDLPTLLKKPNIWQKQDNKYKFNAETARYIDLYPIQMCSVDQLENGKSVLSTNFDTYTLILQLGAILTTVSEWKYTNHILRVIVFVETPEEIDDERVRLSELLSTLRINAEPKIICLSDGSLPMYNCLIKGYTRTANNKEDFKKIDSCLQNDQWWKNLSSARSAIRDIERQKAKRLQQQRGDVTPRNIKRFDPLNLSNGVSFTEHLQPLSIGNEGNRLSFNAKRRGTISDLHEQGISLSLNMRSQGGLFYHHAVESSDESESEIDTESDFEQSNNDFYDSEVSISSNSSNQVDGESTTNSPLSSTAGSSTHLKPQPPTISRYNLGNVALEHLRRHKGGSKADDLFKNSQSSDQLSIRSSVSNLRPNFLSVKMPQAKVNDDEDGSDDDNIQSIRFVGEEDKGKEDEEDEEDEDADEEDDEEGQEGEDIASSKSRSSSASQVGIDELNEASETVIEHAFAKKNPPKLSSSSVKRDSSVDPLASLPGSGTVTPQKQRGRTTDLKNDRSQLGAGVRSPSLFSVHEEVIKKLRTPKFRPDEGVDKDEPSNLNLNAKPQSPEAVAAEYKGTSPTKKDETSETVDDQEDDSISLKQLQEELKQLTFNDLPAKGQHLILNELMKLNSPADRTDIIFSTLPAPQLGTHLDEGDSFDYTNNLSIWMHDLPPVLLLNSQTVTVTTNL